MLKKISTSKTLIADGNYAANDVLSESATNGQGTAWTFSSPAVANGRGGHIVGATIQFTKSGGITAITPRTSLFLFTVTPTSELDDNAANTAPIFADRASFIGRIDFPALSTLQGSVIASTSQAVVSTFGNLPMPFICAGGDNALYGILVTQDAETSETAATVVVIDLYVLQDT